MMSMRPWLGVVLVACGSSPALADDRPFPATLAGHARMPAASFMAPPADAPASLRTSGKYAGTEPRRIDRVASVPGVSFLSAKDAPRSTGLDFPFKGQAVQGFSGIKASRQGRYWVLSDNGFGSKANSVDAMLMLHEVHPDWSTGKVTRLGTVFLHDPDHKLPFHIVNEGTAKRYLTGADLDIESVQWVDGSFWFGDELGPYLVQTDPRGKVLSFHETLKDGVVLRSPDHHRVQTPATPGSFTTPVRRSRGYEGMAASKDGRHLYPMLEGPLWDEATQAWEQHQGREYLRILEFDLQRRAWTGRSWKYLLEANGHNIGDFNLIDDATALLIERDNGEGLASQACPAGAPPRSDCQNSPARFKRIVKISLADADADGFVRKIGHLDLLDIQDPQGLGRAATVGGVFSFPFVTIEDVDIVDAEHLIVANDNNLPFSSGRALGRNDDNEFILLRAPEFLQAR